MSLNLSSPAVAQSSGVLTLRLSLETAGDCLLSDLPRIGGFFFHACQDAKGDLAKRLHGGALALFIGSFPLVAVSLLSAINHGTESQCVISQCHFINNPRVSS